MPAGATAASGVAGLRQPGLARQSGRVIRDPATSRCEAGCLGQPVDDAQLLELAGHFVGVHVLHAVELQGPQILLVDVQGVDQLLDRGQLLLLADHEDPVGPLIGVQVHARLGLLGHLAPGRGHLGPLGGLGGPNLGQPGPVGDIRLARAAGPSRPPADPGCRWSPSRSQAARPAP